MAGGVAEPSVTIITPTYEHEAFIEACLDSAIAQTFPDWELIVVDDGSTDRTVERALARNDRRIRVVRRAHQGLPGLGEAYREALASSSGRLVAILEGDDAWPPEKLARQVPDFDDDAIVLSYASAGLIDERGCLFGVARPAVPAAARRNEPTGSILPTLALGNPLVSATVMVRRAALERIGGFWQPDGMPYVDHPTWLRLALEGSFAHHADVLGYWRRHARQYTTASMAAQEPLDPGPYVLEVLHSAGAAGIGAPLPTPEEIARRNRDRVLLNRWRLALVVGSPISVLALFASLLRTLRPRLVAAAWLGLVSWAVGADLEWLQRRRRGVGWASRRHLRSRAHRTRTADQTP